MHGPVGAPVRDEAPARVVCSPALVSVASRVRRAVVDAGALDLRGELTGAVVCRAERPDTRLEAGQGRRDSERGAPVVERTELLGTEPEDSMHQDDGALVRQSARSSGSASRVSGLTALGATGPPPAGSSA